MRRHAIAIALGALLPAVPATASDFIPPAGCETFLTVQNRSCTVSLLWRCDVAPEGDFWEATFSDLGLESVISYTAAYQWLDSVYLWDSSREEFTPPAADPIDLATLIETGTDSYDFTMRRSEPDRSYDIRVTGTDRLTGDTLEIDGYLFDKVATRLEIVADDGTVEYASEGFQYLSRELGLFFLGEEQVTGADGETFDYDDTPVDIILPGEPGFGATTPLYECGLQDARYLPGGKR